MSFSHWTLACGIIPKTKSLAQGHLRQAWMHPQSKDGPVLRLRSRRALSPGPREQLGRRPAFCQVQNERTPDQCELKACAKFIALVA